MGKKNPFEGDIGGFFERKALDREEKKHNVYAWLDSKLMNMQWYLLASTFIIKSQNAGFDLFPTIFFKIMVRTLYPYKKFERGILSLLSQSLPTTL